MNNPDKTDRDINSYLDEALNFFYDHKHEWIFHATNLDYKIFKEKPDYVFASQVIDKFKREFLIIEQRDKWPTANSSDTIKYRITADGMAFKESGGFRQKQEDIVLDRERLKSDRTVTLRNDKRLVQGTWFLGAGTIAIVLWEIFVFLYEHC